jgi:hypothetical protein
LAYSTGFDLLMTFSTLLHPQNLDRFRGERNRPMAYRRPH